MNCMSQTSKPVNTRNGENKTFRTFILFDSIPAILFNS